MGQPAQDAKQRIQWIDAARGLAMVLVVLGHIAQNYYRQDISADDTYIVYKVIYSFHIPLFLMISGYMFHRGYVDPNGEIKGARLKKQFLNILLIYVMFSIFEGILKIFISGDGVDSTSVKDVLLFWLKPIGGRLWYLYVLLEYYAIFSRRWIIRNIGKVWVIVPVCLLAAGSEFLDSGWYFCIKIAATNILPFYIGILLSLYGVEAVRKIGWAIPALLVVGAESGFIPAVWWKTRSRFFPCCTALCSLPVSFFCFGVSVSCRRAVSCRGSGAIPWRSSSCMNIR